MPVSSRIPPVQAVASTPALPVTLSEGDVIEARVAAVLPNGQVRLATSLGTTDVTTQVPLAEGAAVRLLVQNVGQQLTLALITDTATAGTGQAPRAAAQAYGTRFTAAQQALAEVLQPALLHQTAPAALFANLKPVVEAAGKLLPPAITAAAGDVLGHALDAARPPTADTLRAAVQGSGIFRETRLAAGDVAAALPAQDLKSALLALRATLSAFVATLPPPSVPSGSTPAGFAGAVAAAAAAASPAVTPEGEPLSAEAPPLPGFPADQKAKGSPLAAVLEKNAQGPAAGAAAAVLSPELAEALERLPAAGREAALQALRSAFGSDNPGLARALARAGLGGPQPDGEEEPGGTPAPRTTPAEPARRAAAATIPRIDLPPRAEAPSDAASTAGLSRAETARLLLDQTDAALDRIRVSQYGAVHRDDPAAPLAATRDQPAWIFDVPILQGREATSAQVRISRDGRRGRQEAEGGRWSVEFALDTTATGPVHAQIRLYGRHVGVTLWAERAETARLLKDQAPVLHDALGQAELDVEDVAVLAGAPAAPAAERGYFVDTHS